MNDLRFAFRQLRKSPGFTAAAVITLGLGIGANTALFSVFKALVLEPLPYPDPLRLVHVWKSDRSLRDTMPLSGLDYVDLREQSGCFEELGLLSPWYRGGSFDLFAPLAFSRDERFRDWNQYLGLGRLKRRGSLQADFRAAMAELRTLGTRVAQAHPDTHSEKTFRAIPLVVHAAGGNVLGRLALLLFTTGLVLLVACANVAGMSLAKGASRQAEVAVRFALGASRGRIVRQWLWESLLVALLGGLVGTGLAAGALESLRALLPADLQRAGNIRIDTWVLAFSLGVSVVAAVAAGLIPALTVSRTRPLEILKSGGLSGGGGGTARRRWLPRLAIAQLAVAVLLANLAIVMFASYRNVLEAPQGFDAQRVLTANLELWGERYATPESRIQFWRRLVEQAEALPGVSRAALTTKLPLEGGWNSSVLVEGEVFDPQANRPSAETSWITPGYFDAMGIPLLSGRTLAPFPGAAAQQQIVVNRAFVDHYWPGRDAIGKQVRHDSVKPEWSGVIVGVVENVRQWGAELDPQPEIYFPYEAEPRPAAKLIVHSQIEPATLVNLLRLEITRLDPDLPLSDVRSMNQVFAKATAHRRFVTLLIDGFMAITLLLAVTGVYGVLSYQVTQRTREIGVRLAFGAPPARIAGLVLRQALRLGGIGVVIGLVGTVNVALALRHLLYGISPLNPLYLGGGALLVLTIALLAGYLPARRAAKLDPMEALRCE
jgi:predicted permease